jgi:RNA polymerase sigma factor (sigma-70 family)
MIHYSDAVIIEGLIQKDAKIIKYVFDEYFRTIKSFILRNNGITQDAEDVFQDAMVIIFQKAMDNELVLECSFFTFLYSVCRNLWLQKLEKSRNNAEVQDIENHIELSDEMMFEIYDEEREKAKIFQQHFLSLSEDCQKILRLFLKKIPLSEIARTMGYKTIQYTKTRKFSCKESLKRRIINDPRSKTFLLNG